MNITLKSKAKTILKKTFFNFLKNSVFGKNMENVKKKPETSDL